MGVLSHKEFYLKKHENAEASFLVNRKLLIHKQLGKPGRTYAVYSDIHGSYDKFILWLKNGMGYYWVAVAEVLGEHYGRDIYSLYDRLLLVVNRDRISELEKFVDGHVDEFDYDKYYFEKAPQAFADTLDELEKRNLSRVRILKDLLTLLRQITRGDEHRIFKAAPKIFQENILTLYFGEDRRSASALLKGIAENVKLHRIFACVLVKLIIVNMLEKHVNLGDTFDRGDGADRLIAFYRAYFDKEVNSPWLHYIWGNHDVLWMGAAIGNPILCVTALRISMRYNNIDFLFRYGFNIDKLKELALKTYKLTPTGAYTKSADQARWSTEDAKKMTKVLLVLEAKLTLGYLRTAMKIPGQIDYADEEERYSKLLALLPAGVAEDLDVWDKYRKERPLHSDVYFPTLDPSAPESLTSEEQELVDDIVQQFTTLPQFQEDMKWVFWKGEMYRVVDNTLYFHAALPATENRELAEIKGMSGKRLLDWLQRDLKRIGEKWQRDQQPTLREKMLFWYLWCGNQSPFFCKSKMATLERAVFEKTEASEDELTTWKEVNDLFYTHIRNDEFLNRILAEFHAGTLVMGHTPVKSAEEGRLSNDIMAFMIDGGASSAYGDKGAILLHTPDYIYLTFHASLEELQKADEESRLSFVRTLPLEQRSRSRLADMEKGYFLRTELAAIDELLEVKMDELYDSFFK